MVYTRYMKLLIALGNPEKRYDGTRHNVGFAMIDAFAKEHNATWKQSAKFKAFIAELPNKHLLVKPTTYYNLVGESARSLADFYKIPPGDILVIHDDHALPLGTIRTRVGGSDAGNNGIKSMNAHLPGTNRLRIGTHSTSREGISDTAYVLSAFSTDEQHVLSDLEGTICTYMSDFLHDRFATTTHRIDQEAE